MICCAEKVECPAVDRNAWPILSAAAAEMPAVACSWACAASIFMPRSTAMPPMATAPPATASVNPLPSVASLLDADAPCVARSSISALASAILAVNSLVDARSSAITGGSSPPGMSVSFLSKGGSAPDLGAKEASPRGPARAADAARATCDGRARRAYRRGAPPPGPTTAQVPAAGIEPARRTVAGNLASGGLAVLLDGLDQTRPRRGVVGHRADLEY